LNFILCFINKPIPATGSVNASYNPTSKGTKVFVAEVKYGSAPEIPLQASTSVRVVNILMGYTANMTPPTVGSTVRSNAFSQSPSINGATSFTKTLTLTFDAGYKLGVFAVPKGSVITSILVEGGPVDTTAIIGQDYIKSTSITSVPDAGNVATDYDVYIFNPTVGYTSKYTHTITIK